MQDYIGPLVAATVTLLISTMAMVKVMLDRRTKKIQTMQDDDLRKIRAKQEQRDLEIARLKAEVDQANSNRENMENMVKGFVGLAQTLQAQVNALTVVGAEVHGNTAAITSNTESLGGLQESVEHLAEEVRCLLTKVSTYADGNEAMKAVIKELAEVEFKRIADGLASFTSFVEKFNVINSRPAPEEPKEAQP